MSPEFSRRIDIRNLPGGTLKLEADAAERAALAERIGIESIEQLDAEASFVRTGTTVDVSGRIKAAVTQLCSISNEPFRVSIDESLLLRFVPGVVSHQPDEEIEIDSEACDEIPYEGTQFDLGEEIAQSLALAIDPYATGPNADRVRKEAGLSDEAGRGPFAALAALRKP